MTQKNKKVLREYLISSLVTFITTFAIATVPLIQSLTLEEARTGALVGIVFVGVRAGIKAVFDLIALYPVKK